MNPKNASSEQVKNFGIRRYPTFCQLKIQIQIFASAQNMALKAAHAFVSKQYSRKSSCISVSWFNIYLSKPHHQPLLERENWLEFFSIAMIAKLSISLAETDYQKWRYRVPSLMGGFSEEAASLKLISNPFLKVEWLASKLMLDCFPTSEIATKQHTRWCKWCG